MTFNVTIPEPIPEGAKVSIGTNFNDWNPADPAWVMTPVDELHYTLTQFADKQYIGKEVQYKYTVQVEGQDSMWARVEGGAEGGEIDNRTFTLEEGGNTVNDTVAMFKTKRARIPSQAGRSKPLPCLCRSIQTAGSVQYAYGFPMATTLK